jgi:hypothetical protein
MKAVVLPIGQVVGKRFTIRRVLTRGLHVTAYEAITAPSREVLLEAYAVAPLGPEVAARLDAVVREVNRLPPNIVLPMLEAGIDQEMGIAYAASEASVTPALADLVRLCPLSGDELAAFVGRLAAALDAAHGVGLLHRTLDPSKVFVGPGPRCDVRLAGFGAGLVTGKAGDPAWAAPEADTQPSRACDVYAAALLTRFAASGALAGAATAAPLDPRLERALAKGLARAPGERYPTAGALARAVMDALGSRIVVSVPALQVALPVPDSERTPAEAGFTDVTDATEPWVPPAESTSRDAAPWAADPPRPASAPEPPVFPFGQPGRQAGPPRKAFVAIAAALGIVTVATFAVAVHRGRGGAAPVKIAATSSSEAVPPPPPSLPASSALLGAPPEPAPGPAPGPVGRLAVRCTPACDTIEIDGQPVDAFPAEVAPGSHTVVARRGTYAAQKKRVNVGTTKPTEVAFVWAAARPTYRPPPKKPCGKFLQRCD